MSIDTTGMTRQEIALALLGRDTTAIVEATKSIQLKVAKGQVLLEADRVAYREASKNLLEYMATLLGNDPKDNEAFEADCCRAQNTVDDVIREILEDDDTTMKVHNALTGDVATTPKQFVFKVHASCTETLVVDVMLPNIFMEDDSLMERLSDEMDDEVRDNLDQEPERDCWEGHDSETIVE